MRSYVFLADLAAKADGKRLDPNDVKPGWVALGIVVLLIIATYFLARSFMRHSKKALQPWDQDGSDPGVKRTTPHDRT
ncbi:hypothetical protein [Aeromicrobium chenweiae]|uniref:Uncharacterized protein n=1 Tax=Aeromicrobium chenweiae TaxID=2079793 RepID=A0A2S0WP79_9ACTN|nr:hypothetical protein [Aeromicrobium chenweiae]AWB93102.1 hypothetical protein C3E78_13285 [Aeromicrobium chenweiae]TGN34090.1 hypothetical protein E4L97_03320 [Aeromicrobium chenweiae]